MHISFLYLKKMFRVPIVIAVTLSLFAGMLPSFVNARSSVSRNKYAALVVDAETGQILYARYALSRRYPASLTKMMTLYLTFQAIESGRIRLDSKLRVSKKAASQPPSKLGVKAGDTIRVYDAVMALVTESANDVAVVLAEGLGGNTDNFARMMVRQARALGMNHTSFKNPSGLPDSRQYTTAYDMAKLGHAMIYHYPGFYPYFSRQSFTYNGEKLKNHNNLMKRYRGMDGIKTGYINASGFNLVASAERGGKRLIGVVFGGRKAKTRDAHMEDILDRGFRAINRPRIASSRHMKMPTKLAAIFPSQRYAQKKEKNSPKLMPVGSRDDGDSLDGWGVQVGAYSEVAAAKSVLHYVSSTLAAQLTGAEQSLQKVTLRDGSSLYRARFTGLEQKVARHTCSYLVKHGHGCLVVTGP